MCLGGPAVIGGVLKLPCLCSPASGSSPTNTKRGIGFAILFPPNARIAKPIPIGRPGSYWRRPETAVPVLTGERVITDEHEAWHWLRNPLPAKREDREANSDREARQLLAAS